MYPVNCASGRHSDQSAHVCSQTRVFQVCRKKTWIFCYPRPQHKFLWRNKKINFLATHLTWIQGKYTFSACCSFYYAVRGSLHYNTVLIYLRYKQNMKIFCHNPVIYRSSALLEARIDFLTDLMNLLPGGRLQKRNYSCTMRCKQLREENLSQ